MKLRTTAVMFCVVVISMAGCEKKTDAIAEQAQASKPQNTAPQTPKFQASVENVALHLPECEGQNCPQIAIQRLNSNAPELNEAVDNYIQNYVQSLVQGFDLDAASTDQQSSASSDLNSPIMHMNEKERNKTGVSTEHQTSLQRDINKFFKLAEEVRAMGSASQLILNVKPELLDNDLPIVAIVIRANNYVGGAHGSSSEQYFNYDIKNKAILNLDEVIIAGKRKAFNDLAYNAFQQWIKQTQPAMNIHDYQKLWPFAMSDNFYFAKDGLILQYGEYEIGPYAVGLPRLVIPYSQLQGILKENYLPESVKRHQTAASSSQPAKS
ncbi:RsiV family protein [Acinetobacter qingfengensis]|nr:RsiV family protein [Acinetobacter qingfengensis]